MTSLMKRAMLEHHICPSKIENCENLHNQNTQVIN